MQYGLVLSRQFRSQISIPNHAERALRLAAVINLNKGKFLQHLQPKIFEYCEQLAERIAATIEAFVELLISCDVKAICMRINVDDNLCTYETEKWPIDHAYNVWLEYLDDFVSRNFLFFNCKFIFR